MSQQLVSIIVPVSGEAARLEESLRSCTAQSLSSIEIIVVLAAAADRESVEKIMDGDPRIRVISGPLGAPSPVARQFGVMAASAPYVVFLEPSEELHEDAAAEIHRMTAASHADVVEFETEVVTPDGRSRIAPHHPFHPRLKHEDILRRRFPESAAVDLANCAFAFRTDVLRTVYTALSSAPAVERVDAMSIAFLACAAATTYASLAAPLHRQLVADRHPQFAESPDELQSAMDAIDSMSGIAPVVREWARQSPNPEPLVDGYESTRLATIARALELLVHVPEGVSGPGAAPLRARVSEVDIIAAAATFAPRILQDLIQQGQRTELGARPVRNVLLTTTVFRTGGVSGVLLTQARILIDAGYRVTIATHRSGSDESAVPDGATLVQISGSTRDRLAQWAQLCLQNEIDVVIDHRVLYSRDWPAMALAARASGAGTIGWIHNFAGRPTYNGNDLHSFMQRHLNALAQLIVLSPLDVAFWKLRGIRHTAYLPNPPSPLLLGSVGTTTPKAAPKDRRLELVWWGRLEQHTKRVTELVEVAAALKRLGVDFRLRIIGPDWTDMSAVELSALASERGLEGVVNVTGPCHGHDLLDAIDSSDIFVSTSIIEGYPLTLPEAQSRGLPVLMYELPWLSLVQNNPGVIAVPQGDAAALASAIVELAADHDRYEMVSRASVAAAERATSYDFSQLYGQLVSGTLPAEFSPEPSVEDGRKVLDLLIFFAEKRPHERNGRSRRRRRSAGARATAGARIARRLARQGRQILDVIPWLRPLAGPMKRALLRFWSPQTHAIQTPTQ